MKTIFLILIPLFIAGCGVVIRKSPSCEAIHQSDEQPENSSSSSTEVSFVLPGPPVIIHPAHPYSDHGVPHGQPGAGFVTICY